jgi:oxygen-independent coproporphyrinogen-3 oxidase
MLAECGARLVASGFERYEVSAYARVGKQCRHNLNYWNFGDYLGVGAGAHGKVTFPGPDPGADPALGPAPGGSIVRTLQLREPRRYLANIPALVTQNPVPSRELPFEFMLNALRLVDGFEQALFTGRTGLDWSTIQGQVQALVGRNLLERAGTRWRPTPQGLRFLNELLVSFVSENRLESSNNAGGFGLSTAL